RADSSIATPAHRGCPPSSRDDLPRPGSWEEFSERRVALAAAYAGTRPRRRSRALRFVRGSVPVVACIQTPLVGLADLRLVSTRVLGVDAQIPHDLGPFTRPLRVR